MHFCRSPSLAECWLQQLTHDSGGKVPVWARLVCPHKILGDKSQSNTLLIAHNFHLGEDIQLIRREPDLFRSCVFWRGRGAVLKCFLLLAWHACQWKQNVVFVANEHKGSLCLQHFIPKRQFHGRWESRRYGSVFADWNFCACSSALSETLDSPNVSRNDKTRFFATYKLYSQALNKSWIRRCNHSCFVLELDGLGFHVQGLSCAFVCSQSSCACRSKAQRTEFFDRRKNFKKRQTCETDILTRSGDSSLVFTRTSWHLCRFVFGIANSTLLKFVPATVKPLLQCVGSRFRGESAHMDSLPRRRFFTCTAEIPKFFDKRRRSKLVIGNSQTSKAHGKSSCADKLHLWLADDGGPNGAGPFASKFDLTRTLWSGIQCNTLPEDSVSFWCRPKMLLNSTAWTNPLQAAANSETDKSNHKRYKKKSVWDLNWTVKMTPESRHTNIVCHPFESMVRHWPDLISSSFQNWTVQGFDKVWQCALSHEKRRGIQSEVKKQPNDAQCFFGLSDSPGAAHHFTWVMFFLFLVSQRNMRRETPASAHICLMRRFVQCGRTAWGKDKNKKAQTLDISGSERRACPFQSEDIWSLCETQDTRT